MKIRHKVDRRQCGFRDYFSECKGLLDEAFHNERIRDHGSFMAPLSLGLRDASGPGREFANGRSGRNTKAPTLHQDEIARQAHMATQDRIVALEKEAAKLELDAATARLSKEQQLNRLLNERAQLQEMLRKGSGEVFVGEEQEAMAKKRLAEVNLAISKLGYVSDKPAGDQNSRVRWASQAGVVWLALVLALVLGSVRRGGWLAVHDDHCSAVAKKLEKPSFCVVDQTWNVLGFDMSDFD